MVMHTLVDDTSFARPENARATISVRLSRRAVNCKR